MSMYAEMYFCENHVALYVHMDGWIRKLVEVKREPSERNSFICQYLSTLCGKINRKYANKLLKFQFFQIRVLVLCIWHGERENEKLSDQI